MRRGIAGRFGVAGAAGLSLLLLPALAFSGEADDAALLAMDVIEDRCAEAWGTKPVQQSEALVEVSTALGAVSRAFDATGAVFLLYWRGAIFQCLGQYEAALDDLEAFVREVGEDPAYITQTQQARLLLRRAGRRLDEAGKGAAATWIRADDLGELRVEYGGGVAIQTRICTDDAPGALHASRCSPGPTPTEARGTSAVPIDLRARVSGWIARRFGLGGGIELRYVPRVLLTASDGKDLSLDLAPTTPSALLSFGPVLRASRATRRAVGVQVRPQVAVGLDELELVAGHYNYAADPTGRQLQGGTWLVARVGLRLEVGAQLELANRVVLEGSGRLAAFLPSTGPLLVARVPAEDAVQIPLAPESSDRIVGGGELRLLIVPSDAARVALGPFVRADLDARWMRVPETTAAVWDASWKVDSTRRVQIAVVAGLTVEVGGGERTK